MAGVTAEQIIDATKAYHDGQEKNKWNDASRSYQRCPAYAEFSARKVDGDSTLTFSWNVRTSMYSNVEYDSFFGKDSTNREDVMSKATSRYSLQKTHYLLDKREPAMRSGNPYKMYDYIDVQRAVMYDAFIEGNEEFLWTVPSSPNDGTAGDVQVFGIPYYVTDNGATTSFGFNGGEADGYSLTAALEKDANTNLKNGNGTFTSMEELDDLLNDALDLSYFDPPYKGSAALGEKTPQIDYVLWSTRKWYTAYSKYLYSLNDNIGKDAGALRGAVTKEGGVMHYRGIPWTWIPSISKVGGAVRDLNESVYGLTLSSWKFRTYDGLWMDLTETTVADAHNVVVVHMDTGYQLTCEDFRSNFVLTQATASAS